MADAPPCGRASERKRSVGGSRASLLGPRPDEGVALALFVVEDVRVDRSVEARIVELDREVVALFGGAFGPGGANLGPADKSAVARGVLVGPVGFGDEADVLGLEADGDDFSDDIAGFASGEGADV